MVGHAFAVVDGRLFDLDARPAPLADRPGKDLGDRAAVLLAEFHGLGTVHLAAADLLQHSRDEGLGNHPAAAETDRPLQHEGDHQQRTAGQGNHQRAAVDEHLDQVAGGNGGRGRRAHRCRRQLGSGAAGVRGCPRSPRRCGSSKSTRAIAAKRPNLCPIPTEFIWIADLNRVATTSP